MKLKKTDGTKSFLGKIREKALYHYTREEGGKRRLKKTASLLTLCPVLLGVIAWSFYPESSDTSFVGHTSKDLTKNGADAKSGNGTEKSGAQKPKGVQDGDESQQSQYKSNERSHPISGGDGGKFKYRATQIVVRQGGDADRKLPIGTSFIGRLLTGIDTREQNSLVRALIPYGASFDHDRRIDKNSVLFGTASHSGAGDKVYVKFHRALFPDGREFRIQAEALSSSDFTAGLTGEENDGAGSKAMTTIGLNMLSGISDALVEKESLSQFAEPTVKSGLRNGFFNGLNKSTQEEAQRRAAKIRDAPDYITIEAGRDLIISLTETFKGESQ